MIKSFSLLTLLFSFYLNAETIESELTHVLDKETPSFSNRLAVHYMVAPDIKAFQKNTNMGVSYSHMLGQFWPEFSYQQSQIEIRKLTSLSSRPLPTQLDPETQDSWQSFGLGLGIETRQLASLLSMADLRENISAHLTYNNLSEEVTGKTFSGPGFSARAQFFKKLGDYFHIGVKLSYSVASVETSGDQNSSDQSLTIGEFSTGLEFALYL